MTFAAMYHRQPLTLQEIRLSLALLDGWDLIDTYDPDTVFVMLRGPAGSWTRYAEIDKRGTLTILKGSSR